MKIFISLLSLAALCVPAVWAQSGGFFKAGLPFIAIKTPKATKITREIIVIRTTTTATGDLNIVTTPPAFKPETTLNEDPEEGNLQDVYTDDGSSDSGPALTVPNLSQEEAVYVSERYAYVYRTEQVPKALLSKALEYYHANLSNIGNPNYLAVVDFSRHSSRARFFIISMKTGSVAALHVSHGMGSDPAGTGYATQFSNVPESKKSSLGVYLTADTYTGKHGYSLRLRGMSPTNSNAMKRAIVIHQASYVMESNAQAGRSWGCLAVSPSVINTVIGYLRGGSVIYVGLNNSY